MYTSGPQAHLLHKLGGKKDLYVSESLDRVLHHCGHVRADIPVPALVICEMKASGVHILNAASISRLSINLPTHVRVYR